jgi:hypothetical protein
MKTNQWGHFPLLDKSDEDMIRMVFDEPGIAGSISIRLDEGIVLVADAWEPRRLLQLHFEDPIEGAWTTEEAAAVHSITNMDASNPLDLFAKCKAAMPDLPPTIRSLVVSKLQHLNLSPIHGLDALTIPHGNFVAFDASEFLRERSLQTLSLLASQQGDAAMRNAQQGLTDLFHQGKSSSGWDAATSQLEVSALPDETILVPPYPAPLIERRPSIPEDSILIDDYDVDHDTVLRAWWQANSNRSQITISALSSFDDEEIFVEVSPLAGVGRLPITVAMKQVGMDQGLNLYQSEVDWIDAPEPVRVVIKSSETDNATPRGDRATSVARELMASVAARLRAAEGFCSLERLLELDPSIRLDTLKASFIFASIIEDREASDRCLSVLTAESFESIDGYVSRGLHRGLLGRIACHMAVTQEASDAEYLHERSAWTAYRDLITVKELAVGWDVAGTRSGLTRFLSGGLADWEVKSDSRSSVDQFVNYAGTYEEATGRLWARLIRRNADIDLWSSKRTGLQSVPMWLILSHQLESIARLPRTSSVDVSTTDEETFLAGSKSSTARTNDLDWRALWRLRVAQSGK